MSYDEPTRYKIVTVGIGGDDPVYLITPDYVSAQDVYLSETGASDEPFECMAEAYTFEGAQLITGLLNKYYEDTMVVTVQ